MKKTYLKQKYYGSRNVPSKKVVHEKSTQSEISKSCAAASAFLTILPVQFIYR